MNQNRSFIGQSQMNLTINKPQDGNISFNANWKKKYPDVTDYSLERKIRGYFSITIYFFHSFNSLI